MSGQAIPRHQQDALPLQTIAQATAGTIVNFGDAVARYWDATTLGVNAVARSTYAVPADGTYYYLATPYLDLRGLSYFTLLLDRLVPAGGAAVPTSLNLYLQMRTDTADAPAVVYDNGAGAISEQFAGKSLLTSAGITFPTGQAGLHQRALISWNQSRAIGVAGATATVGYNVRLMVSWSTTDPLAVNLWTAWMWGQG